jgi:myo-inositol-1(or 4)-monophosphatase
VAANPRVYGQLVSMLGKYSKFASAGDKAAVRQTLSMPVAAEGEASEAAPAAIEAPAQPAPSTDAPKADEAPF